MARIYPWSGKKGTYWYLDYSVDGRRVRKRVGRNKRMAELALADVQVKLERRELGFQAKDKNRDDFIREYLQYAKSNKAEKSHERDVQTLKHFTRLIQSDRLAALTAPHLEAYKARRQKEGAKASTINRELNTIKAMLNKAVAWGYLAKNPAQTVKKLKEHKRQVRYLSPQEARLLIETAKPRLKSIIVTMLYTGLRRDELIHLTWDDVNFDRKLLSIQAKDDWHPKDYEVRHIPLNEKLIQLLARFKGGGKNHVFTNGEGGILNGNVLSRDFRRLARACGIEGVSIHTLRHTFASYLAMKGVDLYTIQKLLGHSSIKTTEIYAHLAPDYLQSAIRKLEIPFSVQEIKGESPRPRLTLSA